MFSPSPRGGHRPVQSHELALPPTLQPHAIHAMAPAPDRRTSAAMAGLIYCGLVGGALILGRATHVIPKVVLDHGTFTLVDPASKPPVEARVDPKPVDHGGVKGSGTRPEDAPTYNPSLNSISDVTPDRLPTESLAGAFNANLPIGDGSHPDTGGNPGATGSSGIDTGIGNGAPVNIDVTALHVLNQVTPVYPLMAKVAHLQGDVVLHMVIDGRGVPTSVSVVQGMPQFQAEAIRAAQQWRFTPMRVNGEAVDAAFNLTLQFRLK